MEKKNLHFLNFHLLKIIHIIHHILIIHLEGLIFQFSFIIRDMEFLYNEIPTKIPRKDNCEVFRCESE